MADFGVYFGRCESKIPKKFQSKNLNDLKLIFLELVHPGLYSGKVWAYRMTLVDPHSKLLLKYVPL